MLEQAVSVDDAARLAGMNRGTLWAWRGRGRLPVSDFDLADVMSLTVAARLTEFGMEVQPAASIAWGVREVWPAVVEIEELLDPLVKADPGGPTLVPLQRRHRRAVGRAVRAGGPDREFVDGRPRGAGQGAGGQPWLNPALPPCARPRPPEQRFAVTGGAPMASPAHGAEVLAITGADLRRANTGAVPLLLDHQATRSDLLIGTAEGARVENGKIVAEVRFSKEPAAQRYYRDVIDGIRNNLSVGYIVNQWRDDSKKGRQAAHVHRHRLGADRAVACKCRRRPIRRLPFRKHRTDEVSHKCRLPPLRRPPRRRPSSTPRATPTRLLPSASAPAAFCSRPASGLPVSHARSLITDGTDLAAARQKMIDTNAEQHRSTAVSMASGRRIPGSRRPLPSMANTPPAASARLARRSNW